MRGNNDDLSVIFGAFNVFQNFDPVHLGKQYIQKNKTEIIPSQKVETFLSGVCGFDEIVFILKDPLERRSDSSLVIDNKNFVFDHVGICIVNLAPNGLLFVASMVPLCSLMI